MAEITSGSLIQDWYDRFVRPLKQPISLTSSAPQDLGLGLPTSTTPTPTAPTALPNPPPTPTAPAEAPTAVAPSWSDRLNTGLQDPAKMGMLGMGLSMMATPPRSTPYSAGEVIGNAGLHGLKFFQQAVDDKRKTELMAQTSEEHALAREDRRTAAEQRNEYYMGSLEERKAAQRSRDAIAADTLLKNKRETEAIGKNTYGLDPSMPMWKVKDLTGLQKQENTPEKPVKPDAFTKWHEATMAEKGKVTKKDLEDWHRSPGSAGEDGPGKTGAIALINKELVSQYLTTARDEIAKNAPPGSEKMRQMVESLNTQDPTTGGPNEAKVREHLGPGQRKEFDFVKRKAQEYSRTMVPAVAVQRARDDWNKQHPAPKVDTKRYDEYRRVYEEIRNYPGWTNAEKNAKIKEMNDKARKMGLIK